MNVLFCDRPVFVFVQIWSKHSSCSKSGRVVAFVRCFANTLKSKRDANSLRFRDVTPFSPCESTTAELAVWEHVQADFFSDEVRTLKRDQPIPILSQTAALSPFKSGKLLRGCQTTSLFIRSKESDDHFILSCNHPVVIAFLRKVHCVDCCHEGVENLKSIIQLTVWILGLLRRIKMKCVLCLKRQLLSIQLQMADLPSECLAFDTFLFVFTRVDWFGPLEVKTSRSVHKKWCCLFTCLATRAIHIEVCHSLSIDSCL